MRAAFIHRVLKPISEQLSLLPENAPAEEKARRWRGRSIYFHDTCVDIYTYLLSSPLHMHA